MLNGLVFGAEVRIQPKSLRPVLGRPFVVAHLAGPFFQVDEFAATVLHFLELGRQHTRVDTYLARRLVHEIDGLVGQLAVGDVTVTETHRRFQRVFRDGHPMVGLVAGFQRVEDVQGLFRRGFLHVHRLEPAGQCRVALDVLAILIQRRRADGLQLPASQRRLEHIAGVQPALSGTGSHQRVHLVQEDDYLTVGGRHLVDDRLQPFLELAPELGPGHQPAHVQRHHPLVVQRVGNVVADDLAGQALGDGGLAHAGLADEHRVVLGAPGQGLHHLADFLLPAHHRVQLANAGQLGEVHAVLFQGAVTLLGILVVNPVRTAQLLHGLVHHLLVDAKIPEQPGRVTGILTGSGHQQVLHADELVA